MSEPVRVLHILQRMEAGGTQALLMNLYRKIDRSKVQFDFLVVYKEPQFYDEEIEKLGGYVYKLSFREDLNLIKFQKDLNLFFRKHNEYKVVHCHAYTIGYFCLKAAKKTGIPVRIAHSHNNEMVHNIKMLPKWIMQKLFSIYATNYFACSNEAGQYLFKEKPFLVLNNSIDSTKFIADQTVRDEIRKELGIDDRFVIGHVGRLHEQKNHAFLIDVFLEVKKQKNNALLLLIGQGPLKDEISNKVKKLNLVQDVLFLGNRNDVNRLYQAMDAFVFPSLFEGLGIVAVEAQASGIPSICSEGLPEEANISPLFKKLSLKDGAKKWADEVVAFTDNEYSHKNMREFVINAGFDITNTVSMMQKYYLDMSSNEV